MSLTSFSAPGGVQSAEVYRQKIRWPVGSGHPTGSKLQLLTVIFSGQQIIKYSFYRQTPSSWSVMVDGVL